MSTERKPSDHFYFSPQEIRAAELKAKKRFRSKATSSKSKRELDEGLVTREANEEEFIISETESALAKLKSMPQDDLQDIPDYSLSNIITLLSEVEVQLLDDLLSFIDTLERHLLSKPDVNSTTQLKIEKWFLNPRWPELNSFVDAVCVLALRDTELFTDPHKEHALNEIRVLKKMILLKQSLDSGN